MGRRENSNKKHEVGYLKSNLSVCCVRKSNWVYWGFGIVGLSFCDVGELFCVCENLERFFINLVAGESLILFLSFD